MYDKETCTRHERKIDAVRHVDGQHDIVHLGTGYGVFFSARIMGKRGGQRRNIQDDFTRVQYLNRRHDWIPVWYQANAK